MERPIINLDLCDLGRKESKMKHWLSKVLAERFELRVTTAPDFVFYGDCGDVHRMYTCKKIYVGTGEPDFAKCDYAVVVGENGKWKMEDGKATRVLEIGSTEPNQDDKQRVRTFFETVFRDTAPPVAAKKRIFGRWVLVQKNR
jgi:hypothetical protein